MEHFTKRLLKIINERSEGKSSVFAKKAGISQATFHNYTKGRMPNAESLYNICNIYNVNINWLLTGKGDVYIKNKKNYAAEEAPIYNKEKDPETAGLLSMTRDVLKSDTDYSASLAANIRSFHHAIKTENRLNGLENEIQHIKKSLKQADRIRNNDQDNSRGEILKKRAM